MLGCCLSSETCSLPLSSFDFSPYTPHPSQPTPHSVCSPGFGVPPPPPPTGANKATPGGSHFPFGLPAAPAPSCQRCPAGTVSGLGAPTPAAQQLHMRLPSMQPLTAQELRFGRPGAFGSDAAAAPLASLDPRDRDLGHHHRPDGAASVASGAASAGVFASASSRGDRVVTVVTTSRGGAAVTVNAPSTSGGPAQLLAAPGRRPLAAAWLGFNPFGALPPLPFLAAPATDVTPPALPYGRLTLPPAPEAPAAAAAAAAASTAPAAVEPAGAAAASSSEAAAVSANIRRMPLPNPDADYLNFTDFEAAGEAQRPPFHRPGTEVTAGRLASAAAVFTPAAGVRPAAAAAASVVDSRFAGSWPEEMRLARAAAFPHRLFGLDGCVPCPPGSQPNADQTQCV
jgi:hypothetical protein